jgi:hypothetical protein
MAARAAVAVAAGLVTLMRSQPGVMPGAWCCVTPRGVAGRREEQRQQRDEQP